MDTVCNAATIWRVFKVMNDWIQLRLKFSRFCTIDDYRQNISKQLFERSYKTIIDFSIATSDAPICPVSDDMVNVPVTPNQQLLNEYRQELSLKEQTRISLRIGKRKRNILKITDDSDIKKLRLSKGFDCHHNCVQIAVEETKRGKKVCVICKKDTVTKCSICLVALHYSKTIGTNEQNAPHLIGTSWLNQRCSQIWHCVESLTDLQSNNPQQLGLHANHPIESLED